MINETLGKMGNTERQLIEKWHLNKSSKKHNQSQVIDKPYHAKWQPASGGGGRAGTGQRRVAGA